MASSRHRSSKRQRTGDSGDADGDIDDDLRLCRDLASLVGRKYVKASELSRAAMLSYLKAKGAVKSVELVGVTVEEFGGRQFEVTVDDKANKVSDMKRAIQEEQGASCWHQALFLVGRGGEAVKPGEEPLCDSFEVADGDRLALCVTTEEKWEWDTFSPLLSGDTKQFELSGEGNSIATKVDNHEDCDHSLVTSRAMESGKHRISFKVMKGGAEDLYLFVGVVRDGAAWNVDHADGDSTDGWFMESYDGCLWGNGEEGSDSAGEINDGQILSMELDADAGTLKFWVDGKRHGPGYTSGVEGCLRWAASVYDKYNGVQIVPMPELE